jgi:hypothetical protein
MADASSRKRKVRLRRGAVERRGSFLFERAQRRAPRPRSPASFAALGGKNQHPLPRLPIPQNQVAYFYDPEVSDFYYGGSHPMK